MDMHDDEPFCAPLDMGDACDIALKAVGIIAVVVAIFTSIHYLSA